MSRNALDPAIWIEVANRRRPKLLGYWEWVVHKLEES